MSVTYIPAAMRARVARQAQYRCGYCRMSEEVTGAAGEMDHLIPESQGGSSEEHNLWLACAECNSFKGDRVSACDPLTGEMVPLFNPRRQAWHDHFTWTSEGTQIVGLTPSGRATIEALRLNRPLLVTARRLWVRAGVHPPPDDQQELQP